MATAATAAAAASNAKAAPDDISLPQPPGGMDGISSLTWSPKANIISSSGWDGFVRCWDVKEAMGKLDASSRAQVHHKGHAPVLSTAFSSDGTTLYSGGTDNAVRMWKLEHSPIDGVPQQIGVHDAPVRHVADVPSMSCVVSGGWDKKLKLWDARSSIPVKQLDLPGRCYALDVKGSLLAVATSENHIITFDVGQGKLRENSRTKSPENLGKSLRGISIFPDLKGYAVCGIEGRTYVQNSNETASFSFSCHRWKADVYSVNGVTFHPTSFGVMATFGSDGGLYFWDKNKQKRLTGPKSCRINRPIPCASFNAKGDIFAYASSYDWSRGSAYYAQGHPNEIYLHQVVEKDLTVKKSRRSVPRSK